METIIRVGHTPTRRRTLSALKRILVVSLISVQFLCISPASGGELLKDRDFSAGIRAFDSCVTFQAAPELGDCRVYQQPVPGATIRTLPDGPGELTDAGKFWDLNEGLHIVDGKDAQIYRMEATGSVVRNDSSALILRSYNKGQPVRQFLSNRHGVIELSGNTRNEYFNTATDFKSKWATNTWPHFLVEQNFREKHFLSGLKHLFYSVNVTILTSDPLPGWPHPQQESAFNVVAMLRSVQNPSAVLFIEATPFATSPEAYSEAVTVDQWGQGIYRLRTASPLRKGRPSTISIDVIGALVRARALNPSILPPAGYYLAGVTAGWEIIGYRRYDSRMSDFSVKEAR